MWCKKRKLRNTNTISTNVTLQKFTTYCVRVSYDGSKFSGWAKQTNLRTVEGEINKILKAIFQVEIAINGASRTDSCVHAYDQIFTFSLPFFLTCEGLLKILNRHFDQDIKIKSISLVANGYDVRKDVKYKQYRYYINTGTHNPFKLNYEYQYCKPLSVRKLRKALKLFFGRNYFYNFSGLTKNDPKSPYRTVDTIKVYKWNQKITVLIQAKGFLRYQIRYMIGAAIDFAQEKISLDDIKRYLSIDEKEKYPNPKAPGQGLYLYKILLKN